jgi:hypothetical protein
MPVSIGFKDEGTAFIYTGEQAYGGGGIQPATGDTSPGEIRIAAQQPSHSTTLLRLNSALKLGSPPRFPNVIVAMKLSPRDVREHDR